MTRRPAPRLHTSQTNRETYKTTVRDKADLRIQLENSDDFETATNNFIRILQQAAQEATPTRKPLRPNNNTPSEIKRLVAVKCKARSLWQKTHTPEDRRLFN
jgi:hypothetical protein